MAHQTVLGLAALVVLAIYLYTWMSWQRFKKYKDIPGVESSLLFGHVPAMTRRIMAGSPISKDERRHGDYIFKDMQDELGGEPFFMVDLRPAMWPMLVVGTHELAEPISRATKEYPYSYPKGKTMKEYLHLLGPRSILLTEGEEWKQLRKRFNVGFAPQHLVTLLPCILDKTDYFLAHMEHHARLGDEFELAHYTTTLTFDIIGSVVMDSDFHAQDDTSQQSELLSLFQTLCETYSYKTNFVPMWLQPGLLWRRSRLSNKIGKLLAKLIRQKFAEAQAQLRTNVPTKKPRSVLAIAFQGMEALTDDTVALISDQLRSFLFAGHDTTAILLQWAFYELSRTPHALATLRCELDEVFGPTKGSDADDAAHIRHMFLTRGDDILHRLPYTSAVIKETLRLYPPAGTTRFADPGSGTYLTRADGTQVCVDGCVLYLCAYIIQRDPAVYGETADLFVPERWLGDVDTSNADWKPSGGEEKSGSRAGKTPAGAWRPFERGPRSCVGQELTNIEARVILAATLRRFDFEKVGLGECVVDGKGGRVMGEGGQFEVKSVLYNTMQTTSRPVDGCKMRVRFRQQY